MLIIFVCSGVGDTVSKIVNHWHYCHLPASVNSNGQIIATWTIQSSQRESNKAECCIQGRNFCDFANWQLSVKNFPT